MSMCVYVCACVCVGGAGGEGVGIATLCSIRQPEIDHCPERYILLDRGLLAGGPTASVPNVRGSEKQIKYSDIYRMYPS